MQVCVEHRLLGNFPIGHQKVDALAGQRGISQGIGNAAREIEHRRGGHFIQTVDVAHVLPGNHQGVTGVDGRSVKESNAMGVRCNHMPHTAAGSNLAKKYIGLP